MFFLNVALQFIFQFNRTNKMFKYGNESLLMTYRVHVCMGLYSVNLFLLLINIKVLRNLNTNKLIPNFLLF